MAGFVPAAEVLAELSKSPLPREAKAAMLALSIETLVGDPLAWPYSWSPFRCEFGFHQWTGALDVFPAWGGNAAHNTHAFGVWQDEPETYGEITALTGDTKVEPQSQITNNWVLAVRDFKVRAGGDLLAALQAGQLDTVSPALIATWPAGADANFPDRYAQSLAMFPIDTPPPSLLEIPLDQQCTIAILSATDASGAAVTDIPADLIAPDDPSVCSASIAGMELAITPLALGPTTLRGADQVITISVVKPAAPPAVAHLVLDLAHPVFAPIAAAARAMIARLPMVAVAAAMLLLGMQRADGPAPTAMFIFPPAQEADLHGISMPSNESAKWDKEPLAFCPPGDLRRLLLNSPCGR
jgi:hypothetical protein